MAISFTKENYEQLKQIYFNEGKHSAFKVYVLEEREYLIKEFRCRRREDFTHLEKETIAILKQPFIEKSGYPLELVQVDGRTIGYLCLPFPNAFSHSYVVSTSFPSYTLEERKKSVSDTTKQLRQFHEQGFIWNDVRLSNHLMDRNGGHMIDFEDSLQAENISWIPASLLHFYHEEGVKMVLNTPSFLEDRRKQALCHLSLLLNVDIESYVYQLREDASLIIPSFSGKKEIQEIVEEVFYSDEVPYFDAYSSAFSNSKELKRYGKKLEKNLKKRFK